ATGINQYGTTISATISGITAGQQLYVKVSGTDSTAFSSGAYAFTLNFGNGASPTVPLPNTQTANGNPIQGGGGLPTKEDNEALVNTTTLDVQQTFYQSPHAVAMDAAGDYVVTWSSYGQDGSGWGVYAQRYDVNGKALGGEFRVNTTTLGDQEY